MTAIASASAHAPVAPHFDHPAHGVLSHAHDPLAFAAVLDSMPGGDAKAKPSSTREAPTPVEAPRPEHPQMPQVANTSFFNAALPSPPTFATPTTLGSGKDDKAKTPGLAADAKASSPASDTPLGSSLTAVAPTAIGNGELDEVRTLGFAASANAQIPASDAAQGSLGADAAQGNSLAVRLLGERSFHASVAPSSPSTAAPIGASSSAVEPASEGLDPLPAPVPSTPITTTTTPGANAGRADRAAAAASAPVQFSPGGARGARQTDVAATAGRAAAPAARTSAGGPAANRAADGSKPDSGDSASLPPNGGPNPSLPSPAQALGAAQQPPTAAFADPRPQLSDAATGPGAARGARTPAAPSTAPVREIDVDLSPGGLEDVSMTMRLAGDKLSLVFRAGSSQTTGAIESARDAIAERLAAIGQPLGSLIIQQTGSTTDATNARDASGGGSGSEGRPQARGGDPNDPRGARRGPSHF